MESRSVELGYHEESDCLSNAEMGYIMARQAAVRETVGQESRPLPAIFHEIDTHLRKACLIDPKSRSAASCMNLRHAVEDLEMRLANQEPGEEEKDRVASFEIATLANLMATDSDADEAIGLVQVRAATTAATLLLSLLLLLPPRPTTHATLPTTTNQPTNRLTPSLTSSSCRVSSASSRPRWRS